MEAKISVIVPVYNVEKYLDRCVKSIINQTLKELEIILVDDGSPDNCPTMCDDYAECDGRVKVIHKKNGGLGFARNSGIEASSGEFIAFVDSDDYIEPDFYEKLYNNAKENNAEICLAGMTIVNGDKKTKCENIFAGTVFDKEDVLTRLLPGTLGADENNENFSSMSSCIGIFSRKLIDENNIRFVSERDFISEDAIFDIDIYRRASRVSFIDSTGYYYSYNEQSLTHSYMPDRFDKIKILCRHELDLLKDSGVYDICKIRIYSTFLGNLRALLKQEAVYAKEKSGIKLGLERMKNIVNDDFLQRVLSEYNYSKLPLKQRISCLCLDKKLRLLTFLFSYLQSRRS